MTEDVALVIDRLETAIGRMVIVADRAGHLRATDWDDYESRMRKLLARWYGPSGAAPTPAKDPNGLTSALARYFAGELHVIDDLPVAMPGTAFQRDVWAELRRIPCGKTISYGEMARRIGKPAAVRAVGLANGANPVGVVVPCHRVIGADGTLTGYGGGIERKRWLLAHEGALDRSPRLAL